MDDKFQTLFDEIMTALEKCLVDKQDINFAQIRKKIDQIIKKWKNSFFG